MKTISATIPEHMAAALDAATDNVSQFVRQAIADKLGISPAAPAHGGNRLNDQPPNEWKSVAYKDRYHLVATHNGADWRFEHKHEKSGGVPDGYHYVGQLHADEIYAGDGEQVAVDAYTSAPLNQQDVAVDMRLALQEWWGTQEDKGAALNARNDKS
jgi:hypothetical protein